MSDQSSFIIAVAGGSGSGKTTFARRLLARFEDESLRDKIGLVSQDSYYIDQSGSFDGDGGSVNFDHPGSLDFDLLADHLRDFKEGKNIEIPSYDFSTHSRQEETTSLLAKPLLILDGTMILSQEQLRPLFDLNVFISIPEDIRFQRRLNRDVRERGRTEEGVRRQFESQVKPMHDKFVEPSKEYAHHLIKDNESFEAELEKVTEVIRKRII